MIDICLIRDEVELVKNNIKKKFQDEKIKIVDEIRKNDSDWRILKTRVDKLRHERNEISAKIADAKKLNDEKRLKELMKEARLIPDRISGSEAEMRKLEERIGYALSKIPNIMHKSVPIGKSSADNVEVRKIGKQTKFKFKPKNHVEIAESLGVADFESSAKTSGNGFYYIRDELALLNQALIRFGIEKMVKSGFSYVETPLMLNGSVIRNVTDLNDMTNQIYKIDGEDLYMIGTSEHSLIGRFIDRIIHEKDLPIKNTSYSMCFRREVGSHGISERGLFRTHQFNKIEMIAICRPEESMKLFDEMKNLSIDICKTIGIPIRVLDICSGDLGDLKHKQIDIEAWSPVEKKYYEIGSCSNLTGAQAKRLKIRAMDKNGNKFTPHTLNNTAIATSRLMRAILENFQQKDGSVKIPKSLQKYMLGKKEIKAKSLKKK